MLAFLGVNHLHQDLEEFLFLNPCDSKCSSAKRSSRNQELRTALSTDPFFIQVLIVWICVIMRMTVLNLGWMQFSFHWPFFPFGKGNGLDVNHRSITLGNDHHVDDHMSAITFFSFMCVADTVNI